MDIYSLHSDPDQLISYPLDSRSLANIVDSFSQSLKLNEFSRLPRAWRNNPKIIRPLLAVHPEYIICDIDINVVPNFSKIFREFAVRYPELITRPLVVAVLDMDPELLEWIPGTVQARYPNIVKQAVVREPSALIWVNSNIESYVDIALAAVTKDRSVLKHVDISHRQEVVDSIRGSQDPVELVRGDWRVLRGIPRSLWTEKLLAAAIEGDPHESLVSLIGSSMTPDLWLKLVSRRGDLLKLVPMTVRVARPEISRAAVAAGGSLSFVPEVHRTRELWILGLKARGQLLKFAPEAIRRDPEAVRVAVAQDPQAQQYSLI